MNTVGDENKTTFRFSCFLILLLSAFHQIQAQKECFKLRDTKRAWSYDENHPLGPANWWKIWPACNGTMQSPVDLRSRSLQVGPNPVLIGGDSRYWDALLTNIYHYVKLIWVGQPARVVIDDIHYRIAGYRFHSPSEHAINGKRYDLEMQIYLSEHVGDTGAIAILYEIGRPDTFLSLMEDDLRGLADNTTDSSKRVNRDQSPSLLQIEKGMSYYRYMGSDSAPPCCQAIPWLVMKEVQTVSSAQLQLIKKASHSPPGGSARPVQPLNGRKVQFYKSK